MPSAAPKTSRYPSSLTAIATRMASNRYQNGYIFELSAPVAAQVDPIHIDIRITPTLQRAVPPIFNVDIRFLVHLTDGGGRDLAAPQSLGDVLHTPDGYTGQVHLNKSFFHTALPVAIPLNNGSLKGDSLELGHLEGDISRGGCEVAVVVTAAIALALLVALIPGRLGQFLSLGLQQLVQCFLYASAYKFLELPLITSSFSCTIFSDMVCCLLSEWCVAISFYQSSANHVSLYLLFNLPNLLYLIYLIGVAGRFRIGKCQIFTFRQDESTAIGLMLSDGGALIDNFLMCFKLFVLFLSLKVLFELRWN